jgi:hypothetical protein
MLRTNQEVIAALDASSPGIDSHSCSIGRTNCRICAKGFALGASALHDAFHRGAARTAKGIAASLRFIADRSARQDRQMLDGLPESPRSLPELD